jgi:hypothetical protein
VDAAARLLAPALPFLLRAGETAAEKAAEAIGGGAWEGAKKLWTWLVGTEAAGAPVQEAAKDVAAAPDDADAQAALRHQLRKLLERDPALRAELEALLGELATTPGFQATLIGSGAIAQGPGAVAAGKGGVAIGGSVGGDVVLGRTGRNPGKDREGG